MLDKSHGCLAASKVDTACKRKPFKQLTPDQQKSPATSYWLAHMIFVLDNYDSFTYNLVQYLA